MDSLITLTNQTDLLCIQHVMFSRADVNATENAHLFTKICNSFWDDGLLKIIRKFHNMQTRCKWVPIPPADEIQLPAWIEDRHSTHFWKRGHRKGCISLSNLMLRSLARVNWLDFREINSAKCAAISESPHCLRSKYQSHRGFLNNLLENLESTQAINALPWGFPNPHPSENTETLTI